MDEPVTGYRLLTAGNPADLSRAVMKSLASGWHLWGGPLRAETMFCQAVYESDPASAWAVSLRLDGIRLLLRRLLEPDVIRQPEAVARIVEVTFTLENELQATAGPDVRKLTIPDQP